MPNSRDRREGCTTARVGVGRSLGDRPSLADCSDDPPVVLGSARGRGRKLRPREYKASFIWQRLEDAKVFVEWAAANGIDHRTPAATKKIRPF